MEIPIGWDSVQDQIEAFLTSDVIATGLAWIVAIGVAGLIISMIRWALSRG